MDWGLIFDVDGVIADTEAVNAEATIAVLSELFGLHGVQRTDFEAGLGRGAEAYVRAAACVHGRELNAEEVAAATAARQQRFMAILEQRPLPAFPGVLELIHDGLADADCRLAIATSSTREKSEAVLRSAGVPYRQMVYVTGSDVTRKKPDPELFAVAADRLGLPPARCVVIEDAPDGVAAAHAAGCRCMAVTNSVSAAKLAAAERAVDSLTELTLDGLRQLASD